MPVLLDSIMASRTVRVYSPKTKFVQHKNQSLHFYYLNQTIKNITSLEFNIFNHKNTSNVTKFSPKNAKQNEKCDHEKTFLHIQEILQALQAGRSGRLLDNQGELG